MRIDDKKGSALKTAAILSIPTWIVVSLGVTLMSITEPNNSGHSDLFVAIIACVLTLIMNVGVFIAYFVEVIKKQGD